mmetsp:Transcript_12436/g.43933  ORF Transcript_12436/g.43933 Transcript_12436/m.43933 type:complete len:122 (-) Transcript_12436:477-842(-)
MPSASPFTTFLTRRESAPPKSPRGAARNVPRRWQGTCCYLEDLFIDESCRGSGAGTLMLRSVAGVAANTNCARFHWQALDWNTAAINFYVALGARRMDDWVSLRMGRKALASFVNAAPPQA